MEWNFLYVQFLCAAVVIFNCIMTALLFACCYFVLKSLISSRLRSLPAWVCRCLQWRTASSGATTHPPSSRTCGTRPSMEKLCMKPSMTMRGSPVNLSRLVMGFTILYQVCHANLTSFDLCNTRDVKFSELTTDSRRNTLWNKLTSTMLHHVDLCITWRLTRYRTSIIPADFFVYPLHHSHNCYISLLQLLYWR